jgi:hypothetical protein
MKSPSLLCNKPPSLSYLWGHASIPSFFKIYQEKKSLISHKFISSNQEKELGIKTNTIEKNK